MAHRKRAPHQGRGVDAKGRSKSDGRYIRLDYWMIEAPAFQELSINAEHVLLNILKRFNGANNGQIGFGCRSGRFTRRGPEWIELPSKLSVSSQARALKELEEQGFIACTQGSSFGQKRLTKNWRLTWLRDDRNGALATKEFTKQRGHRCTIRAVQKTKASAAGETMGGNIVPLVKLSAESETQKTPLQSHGTHYAARS